MPHSIDRSFITPKSNRIAKNKIDGWLVVDKPLNITSTRVGQVIKRMWRPCKIGHVGTLDPLASGVLVMALGEATKLIPYLNTDVKKYRFHVAFGEQRSTDDAEGGIVQRSDYIPTINEIAEILPKFHGIIQQVPPLYSAIHINGERAYKIARKGGVVSMPSRSIRIDQLHCHGVVDERSFAFEVECGGGTYVRSLARDIAQSLGTCGYVSYLRRIGDGIFSEKNIISLEKIEKENYNISVILPLSFVLDDIPAITTNVEDYKRLHQGLSIVHSRQDLKDEQTVRLEIHGQLHAIGVVDGAVIKPKRIIHIGENDVDYS